MSQKAEHGEDVAYFHWPIRARVDIEKVKTTPLKRTSNAADGTDDAVPFLGYAAP